MTLFNNLNHTVGKFTEATDIALVLDGSTSVGKRNFERTKKFVEQVAGRILSSEMDPLKILRLAVIQYSGNNQQILEVPFTNGIEFVIPKVKAINYMDGPTDLPDALRYLTEFYKRVARTDVKKKAVIFSDGRSLSVVREQIPIQAAAAMTAGIQVYSVVVGDGFDEDGICQLVTGRQSGYNYTFVEERVFRVPQYKDLAKIIMHHRLIRKVSLQ
uniref:Collagen alpha-1(VI) chain-like n=1 Tax=Callorhinchus milii TaxID=7868 RepID=A0A4W3KKE2_CALMI|eukprot:gi/632945293/ref/XP_007887970.1/ PREDICTED: collagen alpha-1(VI) chain-like [Callorhinchus milii]